MEKIAILNDIEAENINLSSISTRDLTTELEKREGVKSKTIPPYEDYLEKINGPAVVLTIID